MEKKTHISGKIEEKQKEDHKNQGKFEEKSFLFCRMGLNDLPDWCNELCEPRALILDGNSEHVAHV